MGKSAYIGDERNIARKTKTIYTGVEGVARRVRRGYVGVNGVARMFYNATEPTSRPYVTGVLTYNGKLLTPVWANYDATKLAMSGVTSATNAGVYTTTFTPLDGFCWEDESVTPYSVTWSIGKATPTVTLGSSKITIPSGTTTSTLKVNHPAGTSVNIVQADPSICSFTFNSSNDTITITKKLSGKSTFSISTSASSNYNASAVVNCEVTCVYQASINSSYISQYNGKAPYGSYEPEWSGYRIANAGDTVAISYRTSLHRMNANKTISSAVYAAWGNLGEHHHVAMETTGDYAIVAGLRHCNDYCYVVDYDYYNHVFAVDKESKQQQIADNTGHIGDSAWSVSAGGKAIFGGGRMGTSASSDTMADSRSRILDVYSNSNLTHSSYNTNVNNHADAGATFNGKYVVVTGGKKYYYSDDEYNRTRWANEVDGFDTNNFTRVCKGNNTLTNGEGLQNTTSARAGNYAVFAGGYANNTYFAGSGIVGEIAKVRAYDQNMTEHVCADLQRARYLARAGSVKGVAVFTNGSWYDKSSYAIDTGYVDTYDAELTHKTFTSAKQISPAYGYDYGHSGEVASIAGGIIMPVPVSRQWSDGDLVTTYAYAFIEAK